MRVAKDLVETKVYRIFALENINNNNYELT